MKRAFFFLLISIFTGQVFGQISVDNYRHIEFNNWSSNQAQIKHQLNQLKAQWATGNDVTMDINLLMNVEATSYAAIFNVRQIAKTSLEVNTLLNGRIETFKNSLKVAGITDNNVIVEIISQVPIYGLKTSKKLFSKSQNEMQSGLSCTRTSRSFLSNTMY